MRFELILNVREQEGRVLPCSYMYELSSWLYKTLNNGNPEFTDWLHNHGYSREKKSFKLFTFSNLYIPRFKIDGDRIHVLSDSVRLTISFYPIEAIEVFVMGLFKERCLTLGDQTSRVVFEVAAIEKLREPEFTSVMRFKTLSPVFIEEQETKKYLSPDDSGFAELLHWNLPEKYRIFYGKEPETSWTATKIRPLSIPKPKSIVIKTGTPQQTRLKGYMCQFELTGEPELLRLGYAGGFGRLNSQGFGCVETMN